MRMVWVVGFASVALLILFMYVLYTQAREISVMEENLETAEKAAKEEEEEAPDMPKLALVGVTLEEREEDKKSEEGEKKVCTATTVAYKEKYGLAPSSNAWEDFTRSSGTKKWPAASLCPPSVPAQPLVKRCDAAAAEYLKQYPEAVQDQLTVNGGAYNHFLRKGVYEGKQWPSASCPETTKETYLEVPAHDTTTTSVEPVAETLPGEESVGFRAPKKLEGFDSGPCYSKCPFSKS